MHRKYFDYRNIYFIIINNYKHILSKPDITRVCELICRVFVICKICSHLIHSLDNFHLLSEFLPLESNILDHSVGCSEVLVEPDDDV